MTSVGSVNIVSRSGSNELHGSAFFLLSRSQRRRFSGLRTRSATASGPGAGRSVFRAAAVGGQPGGPIKKDKLFWFLNFENNNQDGVFPVTNNHAIYSQFDHIAANPLSAKQANAKFDWRVSEKHSAYIRLSTDNNDNNNPSGGVRMPSNWVVTKNVAAQIGSGLSSVFTPRLVNDLRYSYGFYSGRLNIPTADDCRDPLFCLGLGGPQIRAGGSFPHRRQRPDAAKPHPAHLSIDRHAELAEKGNAPASFRRRVGASLPHRQLGLRRAGDDHASRPGHCFHARLPDQRPGDSSR